MFLDFFLTLRACSVPVSTSEYLDLIKVLKELTAKGEELSAKRFYSISRHCLVKDLKYFDQFDLCFSYLFNDLINADHKFKERLNEWLSKAAEKQLSREQKQKAMQLPPEDLIKELEKRLKEQKERHDGGNHWIGTGGTSAFGHSGYNPNGIRIGGKSKSQSALAVAGERRFKNYRTDQTLGVRQIKMALKELRTLEKKGRPSVSVQRSIDETCKQAGEIQIVEESTRKNTMKLILLMDVGGSMTEHSTRAEELFSALHQVNHFKEFKSFYFHNIFYDHFYTSAELSWENAVEIDEIFHRFGPETRCIVLGDAYMAPYELFQMNGETRNYYDTLGMRNYSYKKDSLLALERVRQLAKRYPRSVWLNPKEVMTWDAPSVRAIRQEIQMHRLSLDGLRKSVELLRS